MFRGIRTVTAIGLVALSLGSTLAGAAEVLESTFENGMKIGSRAWPISGNAPVVSTTVARSGKYSMKTSLNRLSSPTSYRTEVSAAGVQNAAVGKDTWYGFSIYLPDDYKSDPIWEAVTQWHNVPDAGESDELNPPVALWTNDGVWGISRIWDTNTKTVKTDYTGRTKYDLGKYQTGKWTDFVFRIRWSPKSDGLMQVWKDGKLVVDEAGPVGFSDKVGPYMKMGIYKGWRDRYDPVGVVKARTLYHDEVRIAGADAKYADVAPGGESSEEDVKPRPPVVSIE